MVVAIECLLAAAPGVVFDLYTDPDRLPEWQPGLRGLLEFQGQLDAPGATYVLDQPGPRLRITVLAVARPHLHQQRADFALFGWVLTARFLPDGDGTRVIFEYRYGRGPRWLWGLVMGRLASTFGRAELKELKKVAERQAGRA
jgi:uncharacterized protein YndB with AHSA1/START domain